VTKIFQSESPKLKKNMKQCIFYFICVILPVTISAQVTIGSDYEPEKGALLDIKTIKTSDSKPDGATTDKDGGGLLLPRVQLTKKDALFFIDSNDPQYNTYKLKHTGLLVYNLNATSDGLKPGIYMWNGMQWQNFAEGQSSSQQGWSLSGNSGTTSSNFIGTSDSKPVSIKTNGQSRMYVSADGNVGIGTDAPSAKLEVNGSMKLKTTTRFTSTDAKVLVINNVGEVGTAASIPAKLLSILGTSEQKIGTGNIGNFNNAKEIAVTWNASEISTNNLVSYSGSSFTDFTFNEEVTCEISGQINYVPDAVAPTSLGFEFNDSGAAVNVIIQFKNSGSGTWEDFTAARAVWVGAAVKDVAKTIEIPPAIKKFAKGAQLRMIFKLPEVGFGKPHGSNGGIVKVGGTPTKGLKIIAM